MNGIGPDAYAAALAELRPHLERTLERAPSGRRFTTFQLIRAFRQDPAAEAAYQRALAILGGGAGPSSAALQVLHGQVFPQLLRACPSIRFAGFAHDAPPDEYDGTAVPSYWRKE